MPRRHHQTLAGFPGEDRIGERAQQGRAWFSRVRREEGQLCVQALPLGLGQEPSLEPGRPRTRRSHIERVAPRPLSPEPKARQEERVLCTHRSLCSRAELSRETLSPSLDQWPTIQGSSFEWPAVPLLVVNMAEGWMARRGRVRAAGLLCLVSLLKPWRGMRLGRKILTNKTCFQFSESLDASSLGVNSRQLLGFSRRRPPPTLRPTPLTPSSAAAPDAGGGPVALALGTE